MIPASKPRLLGVALVVTALLVVLGVRLYYVQVKQHVSYEALATQDQVREVVEPAVRGGIVSDDGQPLVSQTSSLVVAVNMAVVGQEPDGGVAELDRLAKVLRISSKTLADRVRLCTVGVKQPCWTGSPYQPIPVAQHVSDQQALQVLEQKKAFPGVSADVQPTIDYPQPVATDAAQILGYLQPITAQEVKKLRIPVTGFSGVDLVGQSGLEEQYDSQLRGKAGLDEVSVNAGGQVTGTIRNTKPVAGDTLVTSLNAQVQEATENALRTAVQAAQSEGNPGATSGAAVVETTSGRIIAMASYPTYDPQVWAGGLSQRQFKALFGTGDAPVLERATQGVYPPGSTWKVTTLTAGIKWGDSLYADYNCPASTNVGGHVFNNDFGNGGEMSLQEALIKSCDTVFYNMGYQIWQGDHRQYNNVTSPKFPTQFEQKIEMEWGFGKQTGIDLPGEYNGQIPTRAWLYWFWKDNAHAGQDWCKFGRQNGNEVQQIEWDDCYYGNVWEPGQAIIASIGQGYVGVTPLQLANGYAALANGGTLYSPRIGEALIGPNGKVVQKITPPVIGHLPASSTTLAYIRNALRGVITSGTAASTFGGFPLNQVCVAGKTGTAQVAGRNSTSNFASFAPCNDPKYVVVMMVPDAGYGADISGPGVRKIWDAIYGLEGQKAALPHGALPPVPHMNTAGQLVEGPAGKIAAAKGTAATGTAATGTAG